MRGLLQSYSPDEELALQTPANRVFSRNAGSSAADPMGNAAAKVPVAKPVVEVGNWAAHVARHLDHGELGWTFCI